MILCDTGPLVALVNRADSDSKICAEVLNQLPVPFITTWPCLTEAMYFLGKYGGFGPQNELWGYVEDGPLNVHATSPDERARMRVLMEKYKDKPMDLADASLVAAAEVLKVSKIFTLDRRDFEVYRIYDKKPFEIVP